MDEGIGAQMRPLQEISACGKWVLAESCEPRIPDHEGHLLACNVFSGNDEVTFILAVCRVKHNDEFAVAECMNCVLDAVEA